MLRNGSISFKHESSTYTSPLQGLTRVEEMTVLGVTFTHTLVLCSPHLAGVTMTLLSRWSGGESTSLDLVLKRVIWYNGFNQRSW